MVKTVLMLVAKVARADVLGLELCPARSPSSAESASACPATWLVCGLKAPAGDERQHCKEHHENEHRARRRGRRDKAAQRGADDNAHVGEHGYGGVDVFRNLDGSSVRYAG